MTITRTAFPRNADPVVFSFETQLDADLATGIRGGNKARLVARCWVATKYGAECGMNADDYDRFRTAWNKRTYQQIHQAFDHLLPQEFRYYKGQDLTAPAQPTPAQVQRNTAKAARRLELRAKFAKAPERLARSQEKWLDFWGSDHPTAPQWSFIRDAARALTEQQLDQMFADGDRTSGDIESRLERQFRAQAD